MNVENPPAASAPPEPWYKYGVAILFLEMGLALALCSYALYLTFPHH